jgi:hypothetical protein
MAPVVTKDKKQHLSHHAPLEHATVDSVHVTGEFTGRAYKYRQVGPCFVDIGCEGSSDIGCYVVLDHGSKVSGLLIVCMYY